MQDPRYPEHCPECPPDEGGCAEKPCEVEEEHVLCWPHIREAQAEAQERLFDEERER